jgi:hypothetical protein
LRRLNLAVFDYASISAGEAPLRDGAKRVERDRTGGTKNEGRNSNN